MIRILERGGRTVEAAAFNADWQVPESAVWIDLFNPTREEERQIEQDLDLELPTREDMAEIETSSRLYREGHATYLTVEVLTGAGVETPRLEPVTFVLVRDRLITIRYAEPRAIALFESQMSERSSLAEGGEAVFLGLLDAIVDRIADILEAASNQVEILSSNIFERPRRTARFEVILGRLGRWQGVNAKARNSLISLSRLLVYAAVSPYIAEGEEKAVRIRSLQRDVRSLTDHAGHLSGDVTFLLDATLGLINIEQNGIIKIFSIAAVIFLPPTLVASYFGMNFKFMAEFNLPWGELLAVGLMMVSVVLPLAWFRRKGWL
ncbi:MAG: magnesium transporter CorA family protein [Caulobacter sp.]|nr:magnesium transporter CorA family protein [Caulobacter sp.]